jgi:hypothetical protein
MYKYIAESQLLPDIPIQKNTHRFVIFSLVYCDRTPPSIVSLNIFIFSQKKRCWRNRITPTRNIYTTHGSLRICSHSIHPSENKSMLFYIRKGYKDFSFFILPWTGVYRWPLMLYFIYHSSFHSGGGRKKKQY